MELISLEDYTESIRKLEKSWITDFLEIGRVLSEISEKKVYKAKYSTFEAYVEDNFSFKRSHAYNFIEIYEKYGQNVQRLDKIKQFGIKFIIASLKIEDNYVDEIIEKVENKQINRGQLIQHIKRFKTQIGSEPSYKHDKEEMILRLKREYETLLKARNDLKIAFENWQIAAKQYKEDKDIELYLNQVQVIIERLD